VRAPARCFVFRVLNSPEKPWVFSRTVVTFGCCFRNFLALIFFHNQRVRLGNFRRAMLPIMSCGIFFMVNIVCQII